MKKHNSNIFNEDIQQKLSLNGFLCLACVSITMLNLAMLLFFYNRVTSKPHYDTISVSIAAMQVFLIVAVIAGFWMIRQAAINEAKKEAIKVVEHDLHKYLSPEDILELMIKNPEILMSLRNKLHTAWEYDTNPDSADEISKIIFDKNEEG